MYLNQNEGSGNWKNIGRYLLPAQTTLAIKVIDSGESSSGPVLRADAFKILLFEESTNIVDDNKTPIPTEFALFQNYPNPFNPSTKIGWQSPVSGHQTLKIYDVLGNEVVTLADEYKPAGTYEVNFIAKNISSGIYFYKLQSSNLIETKKMILLK
ncbi:MAG: T9SS type A sorting domain-containing protein [Ignavibacteriales bacterium]|nr:T9SS type A sorting domain-containing protein [Ignavibacteriales bacterium]